MRGRIQDRALQLLKAWSTEANSSQTQFDHCRECEYIESCYDDSGWEPRFLTAECYAGPSRHQKKLNWESTTYSDGYEEFPAVFVHWSEIASYLGEPHTGDWKQDEQLIAGLLAAGAPAWVQTALGWVDELGWGLYTKG